MCLCGVGVPVWSGCGCVEWVCLCGVGVPVWSGYACVEWVWLCGVDVPMCSGCGCVEWMCKGTICTMEVVRCGVRMVGGCSQVAGMVATMRNLFSLPAVSCRGPWVWRIRC